MAGISITTFAQYAANGSSAGPGSATAFNLVGKNSVVVVTRTTKTITGITDTAANLYTRVYDLVTYGGYHVSIYFCPSAIANAANVVRMAIQATDSYWAFGVWQLQPVGGKIVFDTGAASNWSTVGTSLLQTSGTFSTAYANEVVLCGCFPGAGEPVTPIAPFLPTAAIVFGGEYMYNIYSALQTNIAATASQAAATWMMVVGAFGLAAQNPVVCVME